MHVNEVIHTLARIGTDENRKLANFPRWKTNRHTYTSKAIDDLAQEWIQRKLPGIRKETLVPKEKRA